MYDYHSLLHLKVRKAQYFHLKIEVFQFSVFIYITAFLMVHCEASERDSNLNVTSKSPAEMMVTVQ